MIGSHRRRPAFTLRRFHGLRRGFTLIEMLLVVGIISVLVTATYNTIAPATHLTKAHNTNRKNGNLQLTNAVGQYVIDTVLPADIPEGMGSAKDICRIHLQGVACTGSPVNGYDLSMLEPKYLTPLPADPLEADASITGYRIYRDRQFIRICNTRLDEGC